MSEQEPSSTELSEVLLLPEEQEQEQEAGHAPEPSLPLHGRHGHEQHQQHAFDPSAAARHEYLGDLDELPGTCMLEEGELYLLPALPLPDVVLMPGSTLPLKLAYPEELQLLEATLAQAPPTQRILVVVHKHGPRRRRHCLEDLVGCTAEVRQIKRQPDGSAYIIAKGKQRVLRLANGRPATKPWDAEGDGYRMHVRVLPEGNITRVPRPIREGIAHHQPWTAKPFDPKWLCTQALKLCRTCLPAAAHFVGGPCELSYWLAANLPLGASSRVRLLQCHSSTERLRQELHFLAQLGAVECGRCRSRLAAAGDALVMTEEGIGGTFVNAHGFVHDMATFTRVISQAVVYQGRPETEHSWFPGYSWTICNCRGCYNHLGWRFDRAKPGLSPAQFWGLRRQALASGQAAGSAAESSEAEDAGSDDDDGDDDDEGEGAGGAAARGALPANLRRRIQMFIEATFQEWRG